MVNRYPANFFTNLQSAIAHRRSLIHRNLSQCEADRRRLHERQARLTLAVVAPPPAPPPSRQRTRSDLERQAVLIELSSDAIFECAPNGRILRWNRGAERIYGWSAEEAVGSLVNRLLGADGAPLALLAHGDYWNGELVHRCKDGRRLVVDSRQLCVAGTIASGPVVFSVNRDITATRALQEEYRLTLAREREARTQAEEANRSKDEFLAILSHELRTPLSPIIGWTQLLRRGTLSGDDTQRALEIIERNARLQKQLIEDLLDASRMIAARFHCQMQPVALQTLIAPALASVGPQAEARGIALRADFDDDLPEISADPTRLAQVVWNLLTNAVKFTPAGGSIAISLVRRGARIRLIVSDTGCGIAPDLLPHVFERFRQGDSRPSTGLGLGLFIVRHIVEAHGGRVWAESDGPGRGATFIVELPERTDGS